MKKKTEKLLDEWFQGAPAPSAPPWFETKVMARLREEEQGWLGRWASFCAAPAWRLAAVGLVVVILIVGWHLRMPGKGGDLSEAFDAFAHYTEETQAWTFDSY